MWSAVEGLAGQYRAVDDTLSVPESRADALTDLVLRNVTVAAQVTLGVPVVTDRPAPEPAAPRPVPGRRGTTTRPSSTPAPANETRYGDLDPASRSSSSWRRDHPRPTATGAAVMAARHPRVRRLRHPPARRRLGRRRHHRQPPGHPPDGRRPRRPRRRHRHPRLPHHQRLPATRRPSPTSSGPVTAPAGCGAAPGPPTHCDLDHTRPWPAGPTSPENLAALCRRHHRLKQTGRWRPTLDPDGTLTWHGPTGTTRVTEPAHRTVAPPRTQGPPAHAELVDASSAPVLSRSTPGAEEGTRSSRTSRRAAVDRYVRATAHW